MNKKIKKTLVIILSSVTVLGTTISAYAANVNSTKESKKERQVVKNENTIIGKISAIDATNVTIQVATRKEIEKQEKNNSNKNNNNQNEKPNLDEYFTLTGETKTINISNANFGNKISSNMDNNEIAENNGSKKANREKKTYEDYKVGDYVAIQTTDDTHTVAQKVNQAVFGKMRGFKGNGLKKGNKKNKQNEVKNNTK